MGSTPVGEVWKVIRTKKTKNSTLSSTITIMPPRVKESDGSQAVLLYVVDREDLNKCSKIERKKKLRCKTTQTSSDGSTLLDSL